MNIGTVVQATCVAAPVPTMTGGTVVDGTYVLVSAQAYTSDCTGVTLPTGGPTTIQIMGTCQQSIDAQGGAQNYAISENGNELTFTGICPGAFTFTEPYTATATTLAELQPFGAGIMLVSNFQKQ